jgi:hypothetical protein
LDCEGRTIWIADAHRGDGKRFVVRADEKLTAFMELEFRIRAANPVNQNESSHRPEHRAAVTMPSWPNHLPSGNQNHSSAILPLFEIARVLVRLTE